MADITVTFGGREVVLKPSSDRRPRMYFADDDSIALSEWTDGSWSLDFSVPGIEEIRSGHHSTAKAAVSAVESKLRQLRSELDGVLGEQP